ncbi:MULTISPECIES: 3-oxoadipate enol-lactonase [unclassified Nocardioides]|uniref:3-oxoadipate enol-lactonase n=1 Tax=unclassified Nocardioides TaxID=2615069 RepID=UPI0006FA0C71|nr:MULTISPECIES: 3-oxoadipate enol-lactonase [unclassified Nocardioides]KQY56864.1 3-oxoadipate enol-lactonase [Nocardioides sp. Root140]KQZ66940.1 3-oxoadipate enol-lactonase [Nocardioides sp. Root151]KRF12986.1 3-oxoadipate enol-lactonase [Nocardioides sp. Soil796]
MSLHHEITPGPTGAPTVVLSNSLGADLHMWDRTIDDLAEHFTVVRYDTRGHGRSPVVEGSASLDDLADDVIGLLDELDLEKVHFVGLSLGGMTGMRLAVRNPDRIDRLVVLCTSAYLGPASNWLDRAATVRANGASAVAEAVVDRWYSPGFLACETDRVAAARAMVSSASAEGYAGCCEAIAGMDLRDQLVSITAPTLAIAGTDDPATPPPHLKAIAETVVDGRVLEVADSAHLANDEQPAVVNPAIIAHLQGEDS